MKRTKIVTGGTGHVNEASAWFSAILSMDAATFVGLGAIIIQAIAILSFITRQPILGLLPIHHETVPRPRRALRRPLPDSEHHSHPKRPHPHHHHHHKGHEHKGYEHKEHEHKKHKHVEDSVLTDHVVCEKLNHFADKAENIAHFVKRLECGYDDPCWKKVKDALYELEFELDVFDTTIDKSNLDKSFTFTQESKIACCYRTYADSLTRLLRLIKAKSEYLEGEDDKYVLTAINSLRAADSTFIYELGRRMHCEEELKSVMHRQGAVDGTTKGSIQEAFSKFIFTPHITGEHFKNKGHHH
ncbi:hypothetical protein G7Z17_g8632 [Cylindrodendrum hubeiense]|uniref:Uncharacterized protein n=1 Tax=Cylindrodendrum hubeiense TaxID=595255 RepID=A0A9P5H1Q3_9HYPO|nr:hypothetical protein G7Z17_g8632 [Cylindrodendrum hubeiense]